MTMNEKAIENARKIEQDARAAELARRYDADPASLTDAELTEMVNRFDRLTAEDPFSPWNEDPADLYGPWWE